MTNFSEILQRRATEQPDAIAYRFIHGAEFVCEQLTFKQVLNGATNLASRLQRTGKQGDRILLVCKSQKNFILGFYACLLAGMVAVPTALPKRQLLSARLERLAQNATVTMVVFDCDEIAGAELVSSTGQFETIDIRRCQLDEEVQPGWLAPTLDVNTLAFLQYTSGSTGQPKGVSITHGNLIHNSEAIRLGMGCHAKTEIFTSLPLFHDMGLIGGVLQSMYAGCRGSFMAPSEFVQYPERWLQVISRFGITVSGGPNFMYELAAREVEWNAVNGVDLSKWEVAFCGAEPIRSSTINKFVEKFSALGFRHGSFYPCYGLAEATLYVTGSSPGRGATVSTREQSEFVGCGLPGAGIGVGIVDPVTLTPVPDGAVGEIWVRGNSIASGYWQDPVSTKAVFQAHIVDEHGQHHLRTGDLGYVERGELFVTGRLKDLIIFYGKKYVPQDIEESAERSHVALRQAGGAAFILTERQRDRLVVVFELERAWVKKSEQWADIAKCIKRVCHAEYAISIDKVVLIKPGILPRTSSGKVRRSQCRDDFLNEVLPMLYQHDTE